MENQVNWTDAIKYITYTTPEGYKCRDNKLYSEKYLKGVMEDIDIVKKKFQDTQENLLKDNIQMNEEMKKIMQEQMENRFYNVKQELKKSKNRTRTIFPK